MLTWEELQAEHKAWLKTCYPGQDPRVALAGLLGEAGEAQHALTSFVKAELYGRNERHPDPMGELRDALGDVCVYVVSWCNSEGVDADAGEFPWEGCALITPDLLQLGWHLVNMASLCWQEGAPCWPLATLVNSVAMRHFGTSALALANEAWAQVKGRAR